MTTGVPRVDRGHRELLPAHRAEQLPRRQRDPPHRDHDQPWCLGTRRAAGPPRLRTHAEEAFAKADELGASPLPGQARLQLLRGHPAQAALLLNSALADESWDRLERARLLPTQVTIALEVGDVETARSAVTELAASAQLYASPALRAAAETVRGELALATGDDDPEA